MSIDDLVNAFAILLVTIDPLGLAPIFVAVTSHMDPRTRAKTALRTCLIALAILVGFTVLGEQVLKTLSIGIPAFQIAGGLLLFWIGFEMVFEVRADRNKKTASAAVDEHMSDVAAFPLAIPLIAGPGSIAAAILLSSQHAESTTDLAALCLVELLIVAITYGTFRTAGILAAGLGQTGTLIFTRLLGIILVALAVETVLVGLRKALVTAS